MNNQTNSTSSNFVQQAAEHQSLTRPSFTRYNKRPPPTKGPTTNIILAVTETVAALQTEAVAAAVAVAVVVAVAGAASVAVADAAVTVVAV